MTNIWGKAKANRQGERKFATGRLKDCRASKVFQISDVKILIPKLQNTMSVPNSCIRCVALEFEHIGVPREPRSLQSSIGRLEKLQNLDMSRNNLSSCRKRKNRELRMIYSNVFGLEDHKQDRKKKTNLSEV